MNYTFISFFLSRNDLLPGLNALGFLVWHEDSEETSSFGLFFLALPLDVTLYLCFVQADGGREIPNTPDAVFLKVHVSNEFEGGTQVLARE